MEQAKYNTVLLIDDDRIVNKVNERLLKGINFSEEVIVKDSAELALAYIQEKINVRLPDIIFLDLNMPLMSGFDFLEEFDVLIQQNGRNWKNETCKIIVLSSSVNDEDIMKATLNPYVYRYLVKPLGVESIEILGL